MITKLPSIVDDSIVPTDTSDLNRLVSELESVPSLIANKMTMLNMDNNINFHIGYQLCPAYDLGSISHVFQSIYEVLEVLYSNIDNTAMESYGNDGVKSIVVGNDIEPIIAAIDNYIKNVLKKESSSNCNDANLYIDTTSHSADNPLSIPAVGTWPSIINSQLHNVLDKQHIEKTNIIVRTVPVFEKRGIDIVKEFATHFDRVFFVIPSVAIMELVEYYIVGMGWHKKSMPDTNNVLEYPIISFYHEFSIKYNDAIDNNINSSRRNNSLPDRDINNRSKELAINWVLNNKLNC